jgi:hypothetical protein
VKRILLVRISKRLAPIYKHKKYRALGPIRQELSLFIYIIIYIRQHADVFFFFNVLTTTYTIMSISKKRKKDTIESELTSGTFSPALAFAPAFAPAFEP